MARFKEKGLRNFEVLVKSQPDKTRKAAAIALNFGARKAITLGTAEMVRQVGFTKTYARSGMKVGQFSSPGRLISVVSARKRATSLRRFNATPATRKGKSAGVRATVRRGRRKLLKRAFFIRLKGGVDSYNEGVAVRLKAGESMENKGKPFDKEGDPGLFLLYGPSVDQLFQTVRDDIHPGLDADMNKEFLRQYSRK